MYGAGLHMTMVCVCVCGGATRDHSVCGARQQQDWRHNTLEVIFKSQKKDTELIGEEGTGATVGNRETGT